MSYIQSNSIFGKRSKCHITLCLECEEVCIISDTLQSVKHWDALQIWWFSHRERGREKCFLKLTCGWWLQEWVLKNTVETRDQKLLSDTSVNYFDRVRYMYSKICRWYVEINIENMDQSLLTTGLWIQGKIPKQTGNQFTHGVIWGLATIKSTISKYGLCNILHE